MQQHGLHVLGFLVPILFVGQQIRHPAFESALIPAQRIRNNSSHWSDVLLVPVVQFFWHAEQDSILLFPILDENRAAL